MTEDRRYFKKFEHCNAIYLVYRYVTLHLQYFNPWQPFDFQTLAKT